MPDDLRPLIRSTLATKVVDLREAKGLSQSGLAGAVGLTRAAISAVESNQQGVSLETLCRLAAALEVEPGTLLPSLRDVRRSLETVRPAGEIADEFLKERLDDR